MAALQYEIKRQTCDVKGEQENFLQGCLFSPDGLCVATSTAADSTLRLYNTFESSLNGDDGPSEKETLIKTWKTEVSCKCGNAVRSYCWYPMMRSNDPATCAILATARDQPAHLFDAYTGKVRATYRPYNALDEMESPTVVAFNAKGDHIVAAGFRTDRCIHQFDTNRPGRESTIWRLGKTRRSSDGQKGLVSALAFSLTSSSIFCVGTYAPGSIYVYDYRTGPVQSGVVLHGLAVVGHGKSHARKKRRFVHTTTTAADTDNNNEKDSSDNPDNENADWLFSAKMQWFQQKAQCGVTQLLLSNDYILYSASRRSNAILAWDLRMMSGNPDFQSYPIKGFASFDTASDTNQRIQFDLDEQNGYLYTGGTDACVRVYNVKTLELVQKITGLDHNDGETTNGVSFHRLENQHQSMLAVATGSRHFPTEDELEHDVLTLNKNDTGGNMYLIDIKNDKSMPDLV